MAKFNITAGDLGPWLLDLDTLMLDEAIELRRLAGFSWRAWIDALSDDDPVAVRFAVYISRRRAGEDVKFADINFNLFDMEITQIPEDEPPADDTPDGVTEEVAEVVPTGPSTSGEEPT